MRKNKLHIFMAAVLIISIIMGISPTARNASAANGWVVTFKYYNGEANKTYTFPGNGLTVKAPTPKANTEGTFVGWKYGDTIYKAGEIIKVYNNMTLEGVWNVSVTFIVEGKAIARKQKTGYKYSLPSNPTKTGYSFKGWYNANGSLITSKTLVTDVKSHKINARFIITPTQAGIQIDKKLWGVYNPHVGGRLPDNSVGGGYFPQCMNMTSPDGNDWIGMCTPCAIGNLLNRKLVLDTNTNQYMFRFNEDVLSVLYYSNGKSGMNVGNYVYENHITTDEKGIKTDHGKKLGFRFSAGATSYSQKDRTYKNNTGSGSNRRTYTLIQNSDIKSVNGSKSISKYLARQQYLAKQLDEHPEGIILYSKVHAIVLTNYTYDSKKNLYSFNAIDTGGAQYDKYDYNSFFSLSKAWVVTDVCGGSVETLLNSADYILYLK